MFHQHRAAADSNGSIKVKKVANVGFNATISHTDLPVK